MMKFNGRSVPPAAPVRVLDARVVAGAGGGPDKTILRTAGHLDARRVSMAAAYLHPENDPGIDVIRATARRFGCPLWEIPERSALDFHSVRRLLDLCRELDINIWHGHDYKTDALGLLLRRFHPMKLVATVHGFTRETWRTRLYYHIDNLALLGYDRVLAVSPQLMKHCAAHGVHPDRLHYVPNAIDADEWTRALPTEAAKRAVGIDEGELVLGLISRLSPEKGVDRAIRALPALHRLFPNLRLHLVGDGPQRLELAALAQQFGVTDLIRWFGWRSDTRRFYETFDALLLPSRTEGLPNVVLEAMAMNVPVASTNVGGVSDLLDEGRCGILLPSDEMHWPQQLAALLHSADRRRTIADRARGRVVERFAFTSRTARLCDLYEQLLGIENPVPLRQAA